MTTNSSDATTPEATETDTPAVVRSLVERGRKQRMSFDVPGFEEAVPLLREAIELDPTSAPAYAELSETYSSWGFLRESSCLGLWHELRVLEFQSLYDLAYGYAETAVRLAPESAAAHRAMSAALRCGAKADPERRAREAELAVQLDGDDPEGLIERWRVQGYDPDDIVLRNILKELPSLLAARLDLAAALCERARYPEAIAQVDEALRLHPANPRVYYEMAMLLHRKGMHEKALDFLRQGRRLRPEDPLLRQGFALVGEDL